VNQQQISHLTMGTLIIVVGLLLLAGQLDIDHGWRIGRLWPVVFLVIGASKVLSTGGRSEWSGWWFIFLGVLFLLHTFRILELHQSWPLFVVWAGVSMMFRPRHRDAPPSVPPPPDASGRFQP
jgi:hypothetical protein